MLVRDQKNWDTTVSTQKMNTNHLYQIAEQGDSLMAMKPRAMKKKKTPMRGGGMAKKKMMRGGGMMPKKKMMRGGMAKKKKQ